MIENLVKNLAKFVEGGLSVKFYNGRVIGDGKCKAVVKDPKAVRDIIRSVVNNYPVMKRSFLQPLLMA
jgi:cyclopropane-fatty-acyl-phospholipid synthase